MHPFLSHYLTLADPVRDDRDDGGLELVHRRVGIAGSRWRSTCPPTPASRSTCASATSPTPTPRHRRLRRRHPGDDLPPVLWTPTGSRAPPACGPPPARRRAARPASGEWVFSTVLIDLSAGVATEDTVLLGFASSGSPRQPAGRRLAASSSACSSGRLSRQVGRRARACGHLDLGGVAASPIVKRAITCTITLLPASPLSGAHRSDRRAQTRLGRLLAALERPSERASSWYQPVNAIATNVPSSRSTAIGSWPGARAGRRRWPPRSRSLPSGGRRSRRTVVQHGVELRPGAGGRHPLPYVTEVEPMSICTAARRDGGPGVGRFGGLAGGDGVGQAFGLVGGQRAAEVTAAAAPVERQASNVSPSTDSHSPSGTPVRPPPLR